VGDVVPTRGKDGACGARVVLLRGAYCIIVGTHCVDTHCVGTHCQRGQWARARTCARYCLPLPSHPMRVRTGSVLLEQVILMSLIGICVAVGAAGSARALDAAAVRGATREIAELLSLARDRAMATGTRTAVRLDNVAARVVVHAGSDTIARLDLLSTRDVRLASTRDSMAYLSSGLGYGAANLRIIVSRGRSHDTLTVSRLGRVRR
jgi:Tfp pilus assembly protein FimT